MIKKLVLASVMAASPLMAVDSVESQPTKTRIEIELKNGFKFKKINSAFAKRTLNWMGNLTLLGVLVKGLTDRAHVSTAHYLARTGEADTARSFLDQVTGTGETILGIFFAIGCKLASDKLFADKGDGAVVSDLSPEKTAQQDKVA